MYKKLRALDNISICQILRLLSLFMPTLAFEIN